MTDKLDTALPKIVKFMAIALGRGGSDSERLTAMRRITSALDTAKLDVHALIDRLQNPGGGYTEAEVMEICTKVRADAIAEGIAQERRNRPAVQVKLTSSDNGDWTPIAAQALRNLITEIRGVMRYNAKAEEFLDDLFAKARYETGMVYLSPKQLQWFQSLCDQATQRAAQQQAGASS